MISRSKFLSVGILRTRENQEILELRRVRKKAWKRDRQLLMRLRICEIHTVCVFVAAIAEKNRYHLLPNQSNWRISCGRTVRLQ